MHCISAIIFKESDYNNSEEVPYIKLDKGLGMIEHNDNNYDMMVRNEKPFITIFTDYFGGPGEQGSRYLPNDGSGETTINVGLRKLGVVKEGDCDEFDTVGLGKYRSNKVFEKETIITVTEAITMLGIIEKKKIGKWDALVYNDRDNNCTTITLDGKGGAIVSAGSYEEAETRFFEAMNFAESVNKLLYFKEHGVFPN